MSNHKENPGTKMISKFFGGDTVTGTFLFIVTFLGVAWVVYFAISTIFIPYQIELREGTALVTTELLLNGRNPYNLEN